MLAKAIKWGTFSSKLIPHTGPPLLAFVLSHFPFSSSNVTLRHAYR